MLAVILPILGTVLTQHMAFLHGIPNSTNLLAVVIVAFLGGLAAIDAWPSRSRLLARTLYLIVTPDHTFSLFYEVLHFVIMVAAALVVWFMNRNRRRLRRAAGGHPDRARGAHRRPGLLAQQQPLRLLDPGPR